MSVLSHLESLSNNLNIAENEAGKIDTSINTLYTRLGYYFTSGMKERFRFGSSVRRTMLPRSADIYSDVDYMIVFDNSDKYKPQTFISRLKKFAEQYYSSSEIYQSHPTLVLDLNHIKFDLVPSYRESWGGLYIPAPYSSFAEWMFTDPFSLNSSLDAANATNSYRIRPLIRLIKYWNAKSGYIYSSFELEQKIVGMSFHYCSNLKDCVYTTFENLYNSSWDLVTSKREKVERAKTIIDAVKNYEKNEMPYTAETEIKKLLPGL